MQILKKNSPYKYNRRKEMSFSINKRSLLLCGIMLVFICFTLIIALRSSADAAYITPQDNYELDSNNANDPNREIRLVYSIFRHGPRTPADTYPNDPHINQTFHPYGWGHLTNEGKKSLFQTGEWLRNRYGSFLGKYYKPDAVWAQTTGVSRTQMSMALVLAALYPPKGTPMDWNRNLNWQPIPIFTQPLEEDNLLLVRVPCPRYREALNEVFATEELQNVIKENKQMCEELTKITGLNIETPDDIQSLYSTLRAESEFGLKLPAWTKEYYPDRLLPITEKSFVYNAYTEELQRLKGGPFLKKMLNEWMAKRDGTLKPEDRKIYLYTGHDATVVNILSAIKVWTGELPIYGIMAIFELLEDKITGEYGVKVYLRNDPKSNPIPLIIPGCGGDHFCPLDKYIELTKNVIPIDFENECKIKNTDFVPTFNFTDII